MKNRNTQPRLHAIGAVVACFATSAGAAEVDMGNPDWAVRWDNSVRASTKIRTESADPALKDSFRQVPTGAPPPAPATFAFPQALNFNAGDQNFQKRGIVSGRMDLLSELDAVYRAGAGLENGDDVIAYCRIGERSAHTWFVLTHLLGFEGVRNYDGSWTEWGSAVRVPIAMGSEPGAVPNH